MSEDQSHNVFLNTPNLRLDNINKLVGQGSHGRVDQQTTLLVSDNLEIPIKSTVTKTFDLKNGTSFFDQEVKVMVALSKKRNTHVPKFINSSNDGKNGQIVMERILPISNLAIAPDPDGNVVADIALKLYEAISSTYTDGWVDTDPKLDSFKLEVDSKGCVTKVRLVDLGAYFERKEGLLKVSSGFVEDGNMALAPELLPASGKKNKTVTIDAEKMAIHNLGFMLASILTPPKFWFNAISAYTPEKGFDINTFKEDVIATAEQKGIKPLDFNNKQVAQILELIAGALDPDPKLRPTLHQVGNLLRLLKSSRGDEPIFVKREIQKLNKGRLFSDKEYVLSEGDLDNALRGNTS